MSSKIPYTFCIKCRRVETIYNYNEDLDYNIDKFNYNFSSREYINSYFENCKCQPPNIKLNSYNLITTHYNLPNKNVITDFGIIVFCKDLMYSKTNGFSWFYEVSALRFHVIFRCFSSTFRVPFFH